MEFIETMIARMQGAPPLAAGGFSALAADTCREQWIHECVTHSSTQEASFATHLLMRALRVADAIIEKIEADDAVLAFFENTSRDVLLYETLHFSLHRLSDELRRRVHRDFLDANVHHSNLASGRRQAWHSAYGPIQRVVASIRTGQAILAPHGTAE